MSEFVSVFKTTSANEAEIVKNTLAAAGIEAFIDGENQAGFSGIFEINVVVDSEQESAAREALAN